MEHRRISLVGPTILVGLGVILLLNNLGYLNWGFWEVARLWPILLIAAGLEILLGHRSLWASVGAALVVLVLIVGGVVLVGQGESVVGRGGEAIVLGYPRERATSASIQLDPDVTRLSIDALDDASELATATIRLRGDEQLDERYVAGDQARLTLASRTAVPRSFVGLDRHASWQVGLNPDVALDLSVDLGVGEAAIDLSRLIIEEARIDFGVALVEVKLPDMGNTVLSIDGGVGTIRINVPEDLGVRIIADAGLVTRDVPPNFTRVGNTYTSPGYERADTRATVTVNLGVGTITVRQVASD
jgi:hypothetical protein